MLNLDTVKTMLKVFGVDGSELSENFENLIREKLVEIILSERAKDRGIVASFFVIRYEDFKRMEVLEMYSYYLEHEKKVYLKKNNTFLLENDIIHKIVKGGDSTLVGVAKYMGINIDEVIKIALLKLRDYLKQGTNCENETFLQLSPTLKKLEILEVQRSKNIPFTDLNAYNVKKEININDIVKNII